MKAIKLDAMQKALEKDLKAGKWKVGGSTISQQLAKNLYLSTSKDPIRKAKEFFITLLLERSLTKDRILEIYMNVIEWGPGIFGVQAAAQAYFGKSVSDLTLNESMRLAAVIPSPLRHRPDADTRYVARRTQIVLDRMAARNMVTTPTTAETTSSPLTQPVQPIDASGSLQSTDTTNVEGDDSDGL